jgi:hypothetical protein
LVLFRIVLIDLLRGEEMNENEVEVGKKLMILFGDEMGGHPYCDSGTISTKAPKL